MPNTQLPLDSETQQNREEIQSTFKYRDRQYETPKSVGSDLSQQSNGHLQ